MQSTRPAYAILTLALVGLGCGSTSDESATPDDVSAAKTLVDRCGWENHELVPQQQVRKQFFDPAEGDVRIVLSSSAVRPGEILSAAVVNDSDEDVRYGTYSHIESASGEKVKVRGLAFLAIGLIAPPQTVGPCVSLPVPSDTAPGSYSAVLDDVGSKGAGELRAEFEVAGEPVKDPRWERRLGRAAETQERVR